MARINGSFNGQWPSYATPYIEYSYTQDIANNRTTVTATFKVVRNSSRTTAWDSTSSAWLEINGNRKNLSSFSFDIRPISVGSSMTILSHSVVVSHNADGSKSINLSASVSTDTSSLNDGSVSGTVTLPTIPRATTPTVSQEAIDLGGTLTVSLPRASSSFTHTLQHNFADNKWTTFATGATTSAKLVTSLEWAGRIPNKTQNWGSIRCLTYNGSTLVGESSCAFQCTVPASVKPTLTSLTATRVDGSVPSSWGVYVKGKSKSTLKINGAAGAYGSTIKSYSISGGGYSKATSSFTTDFLNTVGTLTFTATVTDSRGRTSTAKTVSITVYDYAPPVITAFSAFRATSSGAASPAAGTYIRATGSYTFASVNGKNSVSTRTVAYRVVGTSTWTSAGTLATGASVTIGGGGIAVANNYEVRYQIKDGLGSTVERIVTVWAASRTANFFKGGTGVAFGQMCTAANRFESAWPIYEKGVRVYSPNNKPTCADIGAVKGISVNGYYGLATPSGTVNTFIRTPQSGLLPYQSGGSNCYIGLSSWRFNYGYFVNMDCTTITCSTITCSDKITIDGDTAFIAGGRVSALLKLGADGRSGAAYTATGFTGGPVTSGGMCKYYYVSATVTMLEFIPYNTADVYIAWINPTAGTYLKSWTKV